MGKGWSVPEETSGERGACSKGTEHDSMVVVIKRVSEDTSTLARKCGNDPITTNHSCIKYDD